jgi:ferric-dicitrate binding protein FerR (iron transport regulator)
VNSSDTLTEASRWLIELQTTDRLEDVWDEFDAWFQASPSHKAAYARAQRHWLELAGLPSPSTHARVVWTSVWRGSRSIAQFLSACTAHWELIFVVLLAVLIVHNI